MLTDVLIREVKLTYSFNPWPRVSFDYYNQIYGVDTETIKVGVGILDKKRNQPVWMSFKKMTAPAWFSNTLYSFYCDWIIEVTAWHDKYGFIMLDYHRYNDYGKNVQINLDTEDWDELCTWIGVAFEYKKIHKCNLHFTIKNKKLRMGAEKTFGVTFMTWGSSVMDCYATYTLGRYLPDNESDHTFTYIGEDGIEKTIPNPYPEACPPGKRYCITNLMYACDHPRDWHKLSSEEIAKDVLGLSNLEMF